MDRPTPVGAPGLRATRTTDATPRRRVAGPRHRAGVGTLLVAAVATATLVGALPAAPVEAGPAAGREAERVTIGTSGRPGRVVSMPLVVGSHSWDGFTWSPWVRQTGPVVTRSPRDQRAQRVCVTYVLEIWRGGWTTQTTRTRCSPIARGRQQVRLPRFDVAGIDRGNWFRMTQGFGWWAGGRRIGARVVVMQRQAEYRCNTTVSTCYVGAGGLCLRAPGTGRCT